VTVDPLGPPFHDRRTGEGECWPHASHQRTDLAWTPQRVVSSTNATGSPRVGSMAGPSCSAMLTGHCGRVLGRRDPLSVSTSAAGLLGDSTPADISSSRSARSARPAAGARGIGM